MDFPHGVASVERTLYSGMTQRVCYTAFSPGSKSIPFKLSIIK